MSGEFCGLALAEAAGAEDVGNEEAEEVSNEIEARTVSVVNDGDFGIYYLYASYSGDEDWGRDRLGRSTLPAGESATVVLDDSDRCSLDIRVQGEGFEREYRGVDVCDAQEVYVGIKASRAVSVLNDGDFDIYSLYASYSGDEDWGRDRLGRPTLPAGESATVVLDDSDRCSLDIRVRGEGFEREYRGVDVCDAQEVYVGIKASRTVSVVNDGDFGISYLYASYSGDGDWGRDRLGRSTLPAGESATVVLDDSDRCSLDIRVEGEGFEREYRGVDVCDAQEVYVGIKTRTVFVLNDGDFDIYSLYASYSGDEDWGRDRLGESTLPAGERATVVLEDSGKCSLDIRIEGHGFQGAYDGVDVCGDQVIKVELRDLIGTAFYIAEKMLITNNHIVEECKVQGRTLAVGKDSEVRLVASDPVADLALLSIKDRWGDKSYATIRTEDARQGEEVVIFGFPAAGSFMSIGGTVMASVIGSSSDSEYTIPKRVPGGTSGSPLLDRYGNVVGVMVSGVDELGISRAVKGSVLEEFLKDHDVVPRTDGISTEGKKEIYEVVDDAAPFTFPARCSPASA